ncbi:unnamed protein product [Didymodactylos carnosus]|uniref:Uncharacterized protein n=1 Tax=Didymodactylos carnosus TaxID=1234261 RepID=A0A8S2NP96_9BILA|nr:unnamed protein product [Didymodactylos carnosus]CAF4011712.1 unnamed protein product [Didymodactylos carnosus]
MLQHYPHYFFIIFIICPTLATAARPTFSSIFQLSKGGYTDTRTGLPLQTQMIKQTLNSTKNDLLKQSKAGGATTSSAHMTIDQLKSVQINATTKLNPTACIALNAIQALQSVLCLYNNTQLLLTFDTTTNSAYSYQQWIKLKIPYINGGKEWNCTNITTGQTMIIMMKIKENTIKLNKNKIIINTTNETNISPVVCFDNITLNMTTEQAQPLHNETSTTTNTTTASTTKAAATTTTTSTITTTSTTMIKASTTPLINNHTIRGKCSLWSSYDSDAVYIYEPYSNTIYKPGQQVHIRWSLNSQFDTSIQIQIILKRARFGIAENIYTWYAVAGQYSAYVIIPSNLIISTVNDYFFDFFWFNIYHCLPIPNWQPSNYFQIPTAPYIVSDYSYPTSSSIYYPGDTVLIRWSVINANFPPGQQILLHFNRHRWNPIPDEKIDSQSINPLWGSCYYTIPTNLEKQANDDKYYFRFDWSSSYWISITDTYTADTQYIYVITKPVLYPILPATADSFTLADTIKITWRARNFDSNSDSKFVIKLKRYRFLIWDEVIYTLTGSVHHQVFVSIVYLQ